MKQTEVIRLIGICSSNYKNWPEPDKSEMLLALWTKMLSDTEYYIAEAAVEKFLAESVYPPTIADIRARIADITVAKEKTAIEAWGDLHDAIRKYGWPNEKKAMESLSPTTKKVVESMGYLTLCKSENEMVDRAHFLKVYDTIASRERAEALVLPSTKALMNQVHGDRIRRIE